MAGMFNNTQNYLKHNITTNLTTYQYKIKQCIC